MASLNTSKRISREGHTAVGRSSCWRQQANQDDWIREPLSRDGQMGHFSGTAVIACLDVDREEGSCIAWSKLWHQQWPRLSSTRTLMPQSRRLRSDQLSQLVCSEVCWTGVMTCQKTIFTNQKDKHKNQNCGQAPDRAFLLRHA